VAGVDVVAVNLRPLAPDRGLCWTAGQRQNQRMDQFYLAALALPVLISIVSVVLALIVLWAVIRSAVFSALQKHVKSERGDVAASRVHSRRRADSSGAGTTRLVSARIHQDAGE
jgi:hypothetical protein